MTKTNAGLVEYCRAQLGLPYWYGTFGQTASASLLASKKKQYPKYYTASDFSTQFGKRVHDCAGLPKGYLWSATPTSAPKYDAGTDWGATAFYQHCNKKGTIDTFDHVPGRLVFKGKPSKMSHVGVYVGAGKIIEAKGHKWGVIESKLDETWDYWGQCELFEESAPAPAPQPQPTPAPTPTPAPAPSGELYKVKTNGSNLRLRVAPNTNAAVLASMPNGSKVIVNGKSGSWSHTTYNGKTGWAFSKWLVKI